MLAVSVGGTVLLLGLPIVIAVVAADAPTFEILIASRAAWFGVCAGSLFAVTTACLLRGVAHALPVRLAQASLLAQALVSLVAWVAMKGVLTLALLVVVASAYLLYESVRLGVFTRRPSSHTPS